MPGIGSREMLRRMWVQVRGAGRRATEVSTGGGVRIGFPLVPTASFLFFALAVGITCPEPAQAAPYGAYLRLNARTCPDLLNRGTGGPEVDDTRMMGTVDFISSVTDSVSASQLSCGFPLASSFPSPAAEAEGYADLGTGKLGIYGRATGIASYSDGIVVAAALANGATGFFDTLYFHFEPGPELQLVFSVSFDGTTTGSGGGTLTPNMVLTCSVSGCAGGGFRSGNDQVDLQGGSGSIAEAVTVFARTEATDLAILFELGLNMNELQPALGDVVSEFDYLGTAAVSVDLPPGVDFTSASGIFLVPEPSTGMCLGLGLAGLGMRRRRFRSRVH